MKTILTAGLVFLTLSTYAGDVTGDWYGRLDAGGGLTLVFHITEHEGGWAATMDSPQQNAMGIALDETTYRGDTLTMALAAAGLRYVGVLVDASIVGTFYQGGVEIPMTLSRQLADRRGKPQEPTDFPYERRDVTFANAGAGHEMAGTLTLPEGEDFDQVAILISGSGPQDRDEALLGHRPFLVLSDYLTRRGVAVLRYDDRGVADSGGNFATATSADFATDAAAALTYLRTLPETQGKRIGFVGHSEGGMIAPMVAAERTDVDFIVSLAGPGTDIPELLAEQTRLLATGEGEDSTITNFNARLTEEVIAFILAHPEAIEPELITGLRPIFQRNHEQLDSSRRVEVGSVEEMIEKQRREGLFSPWFRYFIDFSPAEYWREVSCPVLAINGSLDLQVPPSNLAAIEEGLRAGGNQRVTVREFPGLNHLFQTTETGAASEYATSEETLNEEVMDYLTEWILTR